MRLAVVVGHFVSTDKHAAFQGKKLMLVRPLDLDGEYIEHPTMAIDYVGAGPGDVVLVGAAPGLAKVVFRLDAAPVNELIMGVVDRAEFRDGRGDFGNSSAPPRALRAERKSTGGKPS